MNKAIGSKGFLLARVEKGHRSFLTEHAVCLHREEVNFKNVETFEDGVKNIDAACAWTLSVN